MTSRYEPFRYVAVPKPEGLCKRGGPWHKLAAELKPGYAIQVQSYVEAKMLHRAAQQLKMKPSIHTHPRDKTIWVSVPG